MTAALRPLLLAYGALLLLLAATVGSAFLELGPWNAVLNILIAGLKAAVIFWFFMHLREAGALVRAVAVAPLLWLLLLFALAWADYVYRPPVAG